MIYQFVDGVKFKMRAEFDFSFLKKYGTVFKVFDDQDSGNICFGLDTDDGKIFVKFAGAPTAEYEGNTGEAVARLKSTLPVYQDIKHASLIRLIAAEEIGGGFAMVYKWAEGKCMGRMYEEDHRFIMSLPVNEKISIFDSVISFLQSVHDSGYVAVDFYDGSIMYDEAACRTTICDIDFFQKKPYINDMGRMWGSARFMSPEEYKLGASLDETTNVFTLGQMGFSLFTDSNRDIEAWPLSAECYKILEKATNQERERRFNSIFEFKEAWDTAKTRYMGKSRRDKIFEKIDSTGSVRRDDPDFCGMEEEMIRSHALCQLISAKKPTDPDYKDLLENLLNCKLDSTVSIVSPFYCDCGIRLTIGKNVTINKGATILPVGKVEIGDNVLIGPDVKIVTVNHDLYDRTNLYHFGKVTIKENAWICIGAIICPGVTIGKNAVVAAGAVVTKDVPDNTMVGGNPARVIKKI